VEAPRVYLAEDSLAGIPHIHDLGLTAGGQLGLSKIGLVKVLVDMALQFIGRQMSNRLRMSFDVRCQTVQFADDFPGRIDKHKKIVAGKPTEKGQLRLNNAILAFRHISPAHSSGT
jgi:hypothetical protein